MSLRRRCCGLVGRMTNKAFWMCFWIGMLVPLVALGMIGVFVVTLNNIPVDQTNGEYTLETAGKAMGQRVSWQEPFTYEAKVYVSTLQHVPSNETRFFERAALVWRSGPQGIRNKHPHFTGKAVVLLPESLSVITDSVHRGVYAHIFIQKVLDDLVQAPELGDPLLIHSVHPVVWWEPQDADDTFRFISGHGHPHPDTNRGSNADYQLVAVRSVSWGMTMEANAIRMANIKGCKGNRWLSNDRSIFQWIPNESNPVVFNNLITRSVPHVDVILGHRKDGSLPKAIEVDIDVQGIKGYMIAAKIAMLTMVDQTFMTCPRLKPTRDGSFGAGTRATNSLSEVPNMFTRNIYDSSITRVLVQMFTIVMLIALNLITIKASVSYWVGPTAKWIGMSRASFALYLADALLILVRKLCVNSDPILFEDIVEAVVSLYILLLLLGRSLNPLLWLRYAARTVRSRRGERTYDGMLPTQIDLKSDLQATEDAYGTAKDAHESGLSSGQVAKIVATREKVDRVALGWARRAPVAVLLAAFSAYALYENEFSPFSADYVDSVLYYMHVTVVWLRHFPQLVVNYRTRSATHTPPIEHLNSIVAAAVGTLMGTYWDIHVWSESSAHALPALACSAAVLVQYCVYFKEKKD